MSDPTTQEVLDGLRSPAPALSSITRRRFLQAGAGAVSAAWLVSTLTGRTLASPLSPSAGILVLIMLPGGNDGLNTVIPTGTGAYHDRRGGLAIAPAEALPIAAGVGLHPALKTIKARYDTGQVAIVRGVGNPGQDLSHFTNVATWMTAGPPGTLPLTTGWIGRYLDGLGPSTLNAVTFGSAVPLHMVGAQSAASALPTHADELFGIDKVDFNVRLFDAIKAMGVAPTGLGSMGDALARLGTSCITTSAEVVASYPGQDPARGAKAPTSDLVEQLSLAAQLINTNLGVRVFAASSGDYDTHSGQTPRHAANLADLDAAIAAFYAVLDPARSRQVVIATFSEFGRRVEANDSAGTDHGTANNIMLLGPAVRAGLHGDQPSLTSLDGDGNMVPNIDFRSVYATVLDRWLDADARQILTKDYPQIDLFKGGPSGPRVSVASAPPVTPIRATVASDGYRVVAADGSVSGFGKVSPIGNVQITSALAPAAAMAASPTGTGYWVALATGIVRSFGDAKGLGDLDGHRLRRPVVGMAATADGGGYRLLAGDGHVFCFGNARHHGSKSGMPPKHGAVGIAGHPDDGYWLVAADGTVSCFGSAKFHGSTGGSRLSKPIVAMARTPTGSGYWLVAADGGIFAFGDAVVRDPVCGTRPARSIVGMQVTSTGAGYRLVASDGDVFCFGDASFAGSPLGGPVQAATVAIA